MRLKATAVNDLKADFAFNRNEDDGPETYEAIQEISIKGVSDAVKKMRKLSVAAEEKTTQLLDDVDFLKDKVKVLREQNDLLKSVIRDMQKRGDTVGDRILKNMENVRLGNL